MLSCQSVAGQTRGLRGFGAAKQVPRGISSLEEVNLSGPDISSLQSLLDSILDSIKDSIQCSMSDELSLLELERLLHNESKYSPLNDPLMCMQHEAGHFLVGYLLGVLPKRYRVHSMEVLTQDKFAEGRVDFLGFEFRKEVDNEKISKYTFTKEKLCDGLDRVLKWLHFAEDEAESLVKWAARITVLILDHHREARSRLAEAMAMGRSVG